MHRTVERMLKTNPERPFAAPDALAACIHACLECAQACAACADACIAEHAPGDLDHCTRLNLDCSDICGTTARLLSRQVSPDLGLVAMTLELCAAACQACAIECSRHASIHAHCQICAATCGRCFEACRMLISAATEDNPTHH